jgi:hypothetical protein
MRCRLRCGITIVVLATVAALAGGSIAVLRADTRQPSETVNGGGSLPGGLGGKATFAIRADTDFPTGSPTISVTGSGEYHDPSVDVDAHLTVLGRMGGFAGITLEGTYTPQPTTLGPGGTFVMVVVDGELIGPGMPDFFSIEFHGGVYDKEQNEGDLLGGNIQIESNVS